MEQRKSRLTTVTGKTRDQSEAERRQIQHEARFPALRSMGEARRYAAMPDSPSGLVGAGQVYEAVKAAVSAAVEGVHAFYHRLLGDEAFRRLHDAYEARDGDWSQQDTQLVLGSMEGAQAASRDRSGYLNSSGRVDGEALLVVLREQVAEHGYAYVTGPAIAAYGKGISGLLEALGEGYAAERAETDEQAIDAFHIRHNQPSGSQAGDGTPEGGQGKEGPPPPQEPVIEPLAETPQAGPPFHCPHPGCTAAPFGSERGMKAHITAKHPKAGEPVA